MKFIILITFCFISRLYAGNAINFTSILQKSKDAIFSKDVKENDECLRKYYFTKIKEDSIWWYTALENKKWVGRDLTIDDLRNIERDIERLFRRYNKCTKMDQGRSQSECYFYLMQFLKSLEKDTTFLHLAGDTEDNGRAKYGFTYIAFATLTAHVSYIAVNSTSYINNPRKQKDRQALIKAYVNQRIANLVGFELEFNIWRNDQITAVTTCDLKFHFWKEFQGACETRWRREVKDEEKAFDTNGIKDSTDSIENSLIRSNLGSPVEDGYEFKNIDASLDKADNIGAPTKPNFIRYHSTVKDIVSGKQIYDKIEDANNEKKGITIQKLYKNGFKARSIESNKVLHEITAFQRNTVEVVRSLLIKCFELLNTI